jgi:hypothetical protein
VQVRFPLAFAWSSLLAALPAQKDKEPVKGPDHEKSEKALPVDEARIAAAFADARAAVAKVLGAKPDDLPPPQLVTTDEVARIVADENFPAVSRREPDAARAKAEAQQIGTVLGSRLLAKYAWSTRSLFVVARNWEANARLLRCPQLTSDHTLRAVLVHELCHALDDRRFDLGKRLVEATTVDAVTAYNAVIEGHAQLNARRVCKASGWSDGFEVFTSAISAVPDVAALAGEGQAMLVRSAAAAMAAAYLDGERFAAAVLAARPETGERDLFEAPPKDPETILQPQWYLVPSSRPATLYDLEPVLDAFAAQFDAAKWSAKRSSPTGKQLATGMTLLPQEEVLAVVASLRAVRLVQLNPTAAPQSKLAILCAMEFDSEDGARRWIDISARLGAAKDKAMTKGALRITDSKTSPVERPALRGFLQEKTMQSGFREFEVASIDAVRGRIVLETVYSGAPPDPEAHIAFVEQLFAKIARRQ